MGGYIGLESDKSEYIRGQFTPEHKMQESIDALNAAISRLDITWLEVPVEVIKNTAELAVTKGLVWLFCW